MSDVCRSENLASVPVGPEEVPFQRLVRCLIRPAHGVITNCLCDGADALAEAATGLVTQRLSELTGLSPSMERQLYAMGQTRFFQMAHWSDEHIARVADQLGLDEAQIRGANWIGQARRRG